MIGLDAIRQADAPKDDWYAVVAWPDGSLRRIGVAHDEDGIYFGEPIPADPETKFVPVNPNDPDDYEVKAENYIDPLFGFFHPDYFPEEQSLEYRRRRES